MFIGHFVRAATVVSYCCREVYVRSSLLMFIDSGSEYRFRVNELAGLRRAFSRVAPPWV
jgi:hypothetical protein